MDCPNCKGTGFVQKRYGTHYETDTAEEIALAYHRVRCPECKGLPTVLHRRYQQIRMAVFDPRYLATHAEWTQEDFDLLIDRIVELQETVASYRHHRINGNVPREDKG